MAKIVSVIDIGSNSARMAIFARTSRYGFYLLEEKKSRVRISEGTYENGGLLQEEPMRRTLRALSAFVQIARERKSRKILCVATSALRDASNAKVFLKRIKEECGLAVRIIDGEKEAYYGGLACLHLLPTLEGISIDVGGGSSEFALLGGSEIRGLHSLDVGAIRLKELFLDGKNDIGGAKAFVAQALKQLPENFKSSCVFGVGGSIRAMSKIILKEMGLQFFHGMKIPAQRYLYFCEKILSSSSQSLKEMGFGEDRIDSIKSGALIFASFLEHLGAKYVITSGVGIREGVFLENLLKNKRFPHGFKPSLRSILDRFSLRDATRIKKEALRIFDVLAPLHRCDLDGREILRICASLAYVGELLGSHAQSQHSAYLAFFGLEYGFFYEQRLAVRFILEHCGKKLPKEQKNPLPIPLEKLRYLTSILTLARYLSVTPSALGYELIGQQTLRISGASYLAREQIFKHSKILCFDLSFEEPKMQSHLQKVYF